MSPDGPRIVIAGGGTGGHISPAIAVAESLRIIEPSAEVNFIATPRPVDARMYKAFGSSVHFTDPPRIDKGPVSILKFPFRALREYHRIRILLKELRADVLFATGGYPSVFPIIGARSLHIPCAIHESNSIPGRANRLSSRFADLVLTGFQTAVSCFGSKAVQTGNPVRPSLVKLSKTEAREKLGIPCDGKLILFLGGSQGARALNDLALQHPEGVRVVLQCGERDLARVSQAAEGDGELKVLGFMDDPSALYSAADIAVARAGSMTVAEMTWFNLPAVYVPYPFAADDHQSYNALEVQRNGGGLVIPQENLDMADFWKEITGLLENDEKLEGMRRALSDSMRVNPAETIAVHILRLAGVSRHD